MPKIPTYTLDWSPAIATYELYDTRSREVLKIAPDSPAWFVWLEQVSSFAFFGKSGHYTARKEAKQRGDRYWSAYLLTGEQLTKKYLGKSADLTLARLERMAGLLSPQIPLPISLVAGTDGTMVTAQPPLLAQQRTPLHPFLLNKLHVPRLRTHLVPRTHLVERLQQGMERPLTLVSAPAGFGKTTLLAQWVAQSGMPIAWLSLEAEDNEPTRFLTSLIAALQTLDAQLGTAALALLRTPQPPPPETVLATLTNELAGRDAGDVALVLDDYHLITDETLQRGMRYLVEYLSPHMNLILATRADPPLPLARLRAQGQLSEVRATDLRFGSAEASAFLQEVMELHLEAEAIATLEQRTEGWIAGLQLAALALQDRVDVSAFLAAFSGSHSYVLDYLSEEVLARQPATVQAFLLHTSILERLSGPLCDTVMGQEGSQAMLEALDKANLFVVALDEERRWYRYHHLFAEVLRRHLQQAEPALAPELHRRASAWYEQHALPAEAVQHALSVPDPELAARLIEPIAVPMAVHGQLSTPLGWLHALPEALIRSRPFLCFCYAPLLTLTNQFEAAEARLQEVEQAIQQGMPAEQAQILHSYVLTTRGRIALYSGDIACAVSYAREALALLPEAKVTTPTEDAMCAAALVTLLHAYQVSGDVTPAQERETARTAALVQASANLFQKVESLALLAQLYVLQGRLHQAAVTYAQVEQAVPQVERLPSGFTNLFYYFGLGNLQREWNNLEEAEQHLERGMALINETRVIGLSTAMLGYTALARLQQSRGNSQEALTVLDALTLLAKQRHFAAHLMTYEAAVRAQLELAQGNVTAAAQWAAASGLSVQDTDVSYSREGEYLILARICIAQGREKPAGRLLQEVLDLLDRLQAAAEAKARLGSVLEILVLRVLALEAQGNRTGALATLERALVLAEPEGYIRLFVDEGAPMRALLRQAHMHSAVPWYITALLTAFGEQHPLDHPVPSARPSPLAEPLTERERDVLGLLLEGASNREIARRLVLSVNTVKRHVYNLCGKLGVQSRAQAIIRARNLDIL